MAKARYADDLKIPDVILELTGEEAVALYTLVGRVGSSGKKRQATSRIWSALDKLSDIVQAHDRGNWDMDRVNKFKEDG